MPTINKPLTGQGCFPSCKSSRETATFLLNHYKIVLTSKTINNWETAINSALKTWLRFPNCNTWWSVAGGQQLYGQYWKLGIIYAQKHFFISMMRAPFSIMGILQCSQAPCLKHMVYLDIVIHKLEITLYDADIKIEFQTKISPQNFQYWNTMQTCFWRCLLYTSRCV